MLKDKKDVVTWTIIIINIIIYIVSRFNPNLIIEFASNFETVWVEKEFYRLITSMFMHANLIHIICNMKALNFLGPEIEKDMGKIKFLCFYLISGVLSDLCGIGYYACRHINNFSVGASGAIYGLYGYKVASQPLTLFEKIINIVIGYIPLIIIGLFLNIGHVAHISAIIIGFVYAEISKRKFTFFKRKK